MKSLSHKPKGFFFGLLAGGREVVRLGGRGRGQFFGLGRLGRVGHVEVVAALRSPEVEDNLALGSEI